nr:acyltransferase [Microbacterium halimionae]
MAGAKRLGGIDLARGLALVGMFAAHLLTIDSFDVAEPSTWIDIVNGRSAILFATLAGVSIALVTGGATPVVGVARRVARRRLGIRAGFLWILGVILIFTGVPIYVILPAYAVLFCLAMPLLGVRPRALFAIAAILTLTMPFLVAVIEAIFGWGEATDSALGLLVGWAYPFPVWSIFLITGLALGRLDLSRTRVQTSAVVFGAIAAIVGYTLAAVFPAPPVTYDMTGAPTDAVAWFLASVWTADAHSGGILEVLASGGVAVAVIGACVLICRTALRWVFLPLRAAGTMPLTAYSLQVLVWAVWSQFALGTTTDLWGFRALEPFWPLTIAVLLVCMVWALVVGRGPLENLSNTLSRRLVPGPKITRLE